MKKDPFKLSEAPSQLPSGPHGLDREVVMASQRGRLLAAFVEVASEKGYHATTIQDIVGRAGTAKRTFYEHFADKDDCFNEAFDSISATLVSEIVIAAEPVDDPIDRIEVGVRAYLATVAANPEFAQFFMTEGMAAGMDLADRWIAWVDALADVLVSWRTESKKTHDEVPPMSKMQALAVLSAVNEVVRIAVHQGGVAHVSDIADELIDVTIGMLTADVSHRS